MIFSISIDNINSIDEAKPHEIRCMWNHLGKLKGVSDIHRILITMKSIPEDTDKFYTELDLVRERYSNYTIACKSFVDLNTLLHKGYNAYLDHAITDWEMFVNLKSMGVSDILIDGPLGFQMEAIGAAKDDIRIRVCPHASFNAFGPNSGTELNSFFIRPEDLYLYADYIDIINFCVPEQEREAVLYKTYEQGYYLHDLSLLIGQLSAPINNNFIHKTFALYRLDCGQRCKVPLKSSCHLCDKHIALAEAVEKSL